MTLKRQKIVGETIVPDPPDTGETTMVADDSRQPRYVDRRLRNRIILLNFVVWAAIATLIWWLAA